MAYPGILGSSTTGSSTGATTQTITYPTGIQNGDRLIAMSTYDGQPTTSGWPAGWTQRASVLAGTAVRVQVYEKICDGTETGTFNITVSVSEAFVWECLHVRPAHASTAIEVATGNSTTSNPDPPSLDPTNWATENTLWIVYSGGDGGTTTYTGTPSGFSTLVARTISNAVNGVCSGYAFLADTVGSKDPGAFTRAAEDWVAVTIAVRPGSPKSLVVSSRARTNARELLTRWF